MKFIDPTAVLSFAALSLVVLSASSFAQANRNSDYVPFTPPPPRATGNVNSVPSAVNTPNDPYPAALAQQQAQAVQQRYGTVESVSAINAERDATSGNGIAAGAILGGVFGRGVSTTGSTAGRNTATILGAIAGGLIGNQVEKNVRGQPRVTAYRINVLFDDGSLRTIEQPSAVAAGSRVLMDGGLLRVVQAPDTFQAPQARDPYQAPQARASRRTQPAPWTPAAPATPGRALGMEA